MWRFRSVRLIKMVVWCIYNFTSVLQSWSVRLFYYLRKYKDPVQLIIWFLLFFFFSLSSFFQFAVLQRVKYWYEFETKVRLNKKLNVKLWCHVVGRIKYLENSLSLVFAGIYFHKEKWLSLTLGLPPSWQMCALIWYLLSNPFTWHAHVHLILH